MKKITIIFAALCVGGILFFSSCAKEEIEPIDTSGDDLSRFKGDWLVSENSVDNGKSTYNVTIADSATAYFLQIAFLYNLKSKKTYISASGNEITIPKQLISGLYISGTGTLENSKRITLKYLVQSTKTHYDTVTAVLTK